MQSKNAFGNLINRYRAVLKKCNLLNTFGSLAMASALVLTSAGMASAAFEPTLEQTATKDYLKSLTYDHDNDTATAEVRVYTDAQVSAISSSYEVTSGVTAGASGYYATFTVKENGADVTYGIKFKPALAGGTATATIPDLIRDYVANKVETAQGADNIYTIEQDITDNNKFNVSFNGKTATLTLDPTTGKITFSGENTDNRKGGSSIGNLHQNFIGNSNSSGDGGAISNDGTITSLTGDFIGNSATQNGGAIFNSSTITSLTGDFIGNSATYDGGAISNVATITSLTGDFIGNSAKRNGGAIYNDGTITSLTGNFINNSATQNGGAIYNIGRGTIGAITANFIGNSATSNGGAIYTIKDIKFLADGTSQIISGNYTGSGATKDYNAIYMDADNLSLNFNLNNGSYTLNDNVKGSSAYTVDITGNGVSTSVFNLNNMLNNASVVNVANATLNFGTVMHDKTYSGSIGSATLNLLGNVNLGTHTNTEFTGIVNIGNNGTAGSVSLAANDTLHITNNGSLIIVNGSLDVSAGTLKVDANASSFSTAEDTELIVDHESFGISADGTSVTYTGKKLDNSGMLIIKGVSVGSNNVISQGYYSNIIEAISNSVVTGGTITLEGISTSKLFSLDDVQTNAGLTQGIMAGTLNNNKEVSASHIVAHENTSVTDSTIDSGSTLTLTGSQSTTLSVVNVDNKGTINLGTEISDTDTAIMESALINNGTLTADSNLRVQGNLTLDGTKATFKRDLTVDSASTTTLSGGTNTFIGTSTFNGAVTNNGGTNEFSGAAIFNANYGGTGSASFNGETTFNNTYNNTGTSTFTSNITFAQEYKGTGTLNVVDGTTNFASGYDSASTLNVGDAANAASVKVTIGADTTMNIAGGGELNIINGTVDVSNGTLHVDGGANTFATGVNGELIVKTADFGTIRDDGSFSLAGVVNKLLDNEGSLVLKDVGFNTMAYSAYSDFLTHFTSAIMTGNGTVQLDSVSIDTNSTYLKDILSGTDLANNVVLGSDILGVTPDGGTFGSGKTATLSGVDGSVTNLGTLTLTGEASGGFSGVLVRGDATNSGTLNLQNGSIAGMLLNQGTVNTNGTSLVNGSLYLTHSSNLNVQSGSFTVVGDTELQGSTLRSYGSSGNDIDSASAVFLPTLPNDIDGNIIAEQNSYIVLGAGDKNYATNAFATSNQDWGTNLTAALFVSSPQILASDGSIHINGASTGNSAANSNSAVFAANSILVVDAQGGGENAALTSSTNGVLTVESGAKLHIANAVSNTEIIVIEGFTGAGGSIADEAWEGDNLTSSSSIQMVKVADFDSTTGSYIVKISGSSAEQIKEDFPQVQDSTAELIAELAQFYDTDSPEAGIRFFSIIMDETAGIGKKDPDEAAKIIESVLQIAQAGAAPNMVINTSLSAANNLIGRLSQAGFNLVQAPQVVQANAQTGYSAGSETDNILNGLALWVSPMYKHSSVSGLKAGSFTQSYDSDIAGISLGGDYTFQNTYRFGLAFNVGTGSAESTGGLSKTKNDFDFYGISAYGAYYRDNFSLMADIGFSQTKGEFSQDVSAGTLSSVSAKTDSTSFTMALNAEYTFNSKYMDVTPYAGIRYMYVHTDAYNTKDNVGIVAQTKSDSQSIFYFPMGVTFSKEIVNANGWTFGPSLGLGMIAAAGDLHSNSVSTIPGLTSSSEYQMQNVDEIAFDGGIGIDVANAARNISFGLNYNLQASKHETAHMVNAMFRYEF